MWSEGLMRTEGLMWSDAISGTADWNLYQLVFLFCFVRERCSVRDCMALIVVNVRVGQIKFFNL